MRLDPPGFTGPPTSNDRSNGNDDPSSTSLPFELPSSGYLPCRRFASVRDGPDGPDTGNATAFYVTYGSVRRRGRPSPSTTPWNEQTGRVVDRPRIPLASDYTAYNDTAGSSRGNRRADRDANQTRRRAGTTTRVDYTARFQEPIANGRPTRLSNSRATKYGFLFVLYLLAWPLVSSTNPEGFAHGTSHAVGIRHRRSDPHASSSMSVSSDERCRRARHEQTRQDRRDDQVSLRDDRRRVVDEHEATHPYNEYSWEVNQVNPWLSACDLAGPAPADLQGSCGPPEVPKNCPNACTANDAEFRQVIEKVEVTDRMKEPWSMDEDRARSNGGTKTGDGQGRPDGVRTAPEQCLFYLEESHKRDICRDDFGRSSTRSFLTPRENRYWFTSGLRLRHCCEHAVVNALAPGKGGPLENVLNGGQKCADALDKLLLVDALAARLHCEFEEVLARYDCAQPYSVIFNCTHCKEAYRKWVCSSLVPYFAHGGPQDLDNLENSWAGSRLRPCRSFCQSVEQRCPYLLPGDRAPAYPTQYAGEPTFLCRDPNIPETGEQASRALHSTDEDECCFHVCSEEKPGSGICANCTDREPRKRGRSHDPPTAPHCEINPIQPASTGVQYPDSTSTSGEVEDEDVDGSSLPLSSSLCGSDGTDTVSIVSSSGRSSASILPQLVCLCSFLGGVLGNVGAAAVLWIARLFQRPTEAKPGIGAGKTEQRSTKKRRWDLVVGWLRRSGARCCAGVRHGARWMLGKWVMVERRCRGWWCWCWWWWRWRRRKSRARRGSRRWPVEAAVGCPRSTSVRWNVDDARGCASTRCRWRRWWWWWCWWWLYRWRWPRHVVENDRGGGRGDGGGPEARGEAARRRTPARRRRLGSSLRRDPP
ncbi:calcium-permeable channel component Mid1 [Colletes latitarsis]|uniref:calcium-permeable channel component Mid1 n=1 Tax=Colletes latitarsis TaxID=2605962 RepID=UPI004035F6A1